MESNYEVLEVQPLPMIIKFHDPGLNGKTVPFKDIKNEFLECLKVLDSFIQKNSNDQELMYPVKAFELYSRKLMGFTEEYITTVYIDSYHFSDDTFNLMILDYSFEDLFYPPVYDYTIVTTNDLKKYKYLNFREGKQNNKDVLKYNKKMIFFGILKIDYIEKGLFQFF
jgi:hypothetical protein